MFMTLVRTMKSGWLKYFMAPQIKGKMQFFYIYSTAYLIVEQGDLALIDSDRQAFQKRNEIFSPFLIIGFTFNTDCLHEEGLTQYKADPGLMFEVDK